MLANLIFQGNESCNLPESPAFLACLADGTPL